MYVIDPVTGFGQPSSNPIDPFERMLHAEYRAEHANPGDVEERHFWLLQAGRWRLSCETMAYLEESGLHV